MPFRIFTLNVLTITGLLVTPLLANNDHFKAWLGERDVAEIKLMPGIFAPDPTKPFEAIRSSDDQTLILRRDGKSLAINAHEDIKRYNTTPRTQDIYAGFAVTIENGSERWQVKLFDSWKRDAQIIPRVEVWHAKSNEPLCKECTFKPQQKISSKELWSLQAPKTITVRSCPNPLIIKVMPVGEVVVKEYGYEPGTQMHLREGGPLSLFGSNKQFDYYSAAGYRLFLISIEYKDDLIILSRMASREAWNREQYDAGEINDESLVETQLMFPTFGFLAKYSYAYDNLPWWSMMTLYSGDFPENPLQSTDDALLYIYGVPNWGFQMGYEAAISDFLKLVDKNEGDAEYRAKINAIMESHLEENWVKPNFLRDSLGW